MRWPVATLAVAVAAVGIAALPDLRDPLIGSRAGILHGELWRLLTSHVVHASTTHLVIDLAAWVVLGAIYEPRLGARFGWNAGAAALTVGAGVALLRPDVGAYAGLSGVVAGVWVGGAAWCAHDASNRGDRRGAWVHGVVLAAAFAKLFTEMLFGSTIDAASLGAEPLPIAHVIGATGGLGAMIVIAPR